MKQANNKNKWATDDRKTSAKVAEVDRDKRNIRISSKRFFLFLIRSSKDQFLGEPEIETRREECERWKKYNKIVEETVR